MIDLSQDKHACVSAFVMDMCDTEFIMSAKVAVSDFNIFLTSREPKLGLPVRYMQVLKIMF